jgi:hypothetical protein
LRAQCTRSEAGSTTISIPDDGKQQHVIAIEIGVRADAHT